MSVVSAVQADSIVPIDTEWVVVRTKAHRELLVVKNLLDRQIESYCPMFKQPAWHLRAPRRPVPLFPSYVFARWHGDLLPGVVQYCPGVRYAVRFGGCLAKVDPMAVEDLRQREGERGFVLPAALETGFDSGCRVRILAGSMKGAEGLFEGYINGLERAKLLIEILRRRVRVEIPVERLVMVR